MITNDDFIKLIGNNFNSEFKRKWIFNVFKYGTHYNHTDSEFSLEECPGLQPIYDKLFNRAKKCKGYPKHVKDDEIDWEKKVVLFLDKDLDLCVYITGIRKIQRIDTLEIYGTLGAGLVLTNIHLENGFSY